MLVTKFSRNAIKHVEEEADCEKKERKKERKKELETATLPRSRGKLRGLYILMAWTRVPMTLLVLEFDVV